MANKVTSQNAVLAVSSIEGDKLRDILGILCVFLFFHSKSLLKSIKQ